MTFKIYLVALVAALGGFVFGFDTGIIATTLGQGSFRIYFYGPKGFNPTYTGRSLQCLIAGLLQVRHRRTD
jgi:hypothetical protein